MSNETRFRLNLTGLIFVLLAWLGGTVATLVTACQPGNGGAVVLTLLVGCVGYGFFREACTHMAHSLHRYPVRDY